jgi:hypothetical protein
VIADVWANPQFTRFVDQTFTDCPTCLSSIPSTSDGSGGSGGGGGEVLPFIAEDNTLIETVQEIQ